jgi:L,D-peptidoglycan transpeptidase YkuD (ErfK/YbiS/YcfS/YnhG family)
MQLAPANGRWTSAEKLLDRPAYDYAQVIGYNEARVPGAGSAIFLHVGTGGATAGCVSVSTSTLVTLLRWEGSTAQIVIR